MKSLKRFGLVPIAGLLLAAQAQAASIDQLFDHTGFNILSDNSAEWLINSSGRLSDGTCWTGGGAVGGCVAGAADGTIDVGDRIRGASDFGTLENNDPGTYALGVGSTNNELTLVFDLTIAGKFTSGAILPNGAVCSAAFCFLFAPTASFAGEIAALTGVPVGLLPGIGIAVFEDTTPDYDRSDLGVGTMNARILAMQALALDGIFRAGIGPVNGYTGLPDPDTAVVAGYDSDSVASAGLDLGDGVLTNHGVFNFQAMMTYETFGHDFGLVPVGIPTGLGGADGFAHIVGSGNALGNTGFTTPYDFWDNLDATVLPIPEPASLALLGMGLLGFGVAQRRTRKAA